MKLLFSSLGLAAALFACTPGDVAPEIDSLQAHQVTLEECSTQAELAPDGKHLLAFDACLSDAGLVDPYAGADASCCTSAHDYALQNMTDAGLLPDAAAFDADAADASKDGGK